MTIALAVVLLILGLLHVYWGVAGVGISSIAIPEVDGKPSFRPTRLASFAVAAALFLAAFLVLARGGPLVRVLPRPASTIGTAAVGIVFLLRAIGDFRLVGFFKRVRGTPFARWDTRLFSPLCLALGLASLWVARGVPGDGAMADSLDAPRIDHILIGAADLEQATEWLARRTGVRPVYGGKHPTGTHNALLSLGQGTYLELIAPQPGTSAAGPFGDLAGLVTPEPVGFAVGGAALEPLRRRLEQAGFELTAPQPGSRATPSGATLRWQTFGLAHELAQAPFFIVWSPESPHPSTTAPAGCALVRFTVAGPGHAGLERLRAGLALDLAVAPAPRPLFTLELDCQAGTVVLETPR